MFCCNKKTANSGYCTSDIEISLLRRRTIPCIPTASCLAVILLFSAGSRFLQSVAYGDHGFQPYMDDREGEVKGGLPRPVKQLHLRTTTFRWMFFSPDSRSILVKTYDSEEPTIQTYDIQTGKQQRCSFSTSIFKSANQLEASPNKRVVAVSGYGRLLLWDISNNKLLAKLKVNEHERADCILFSPDSASIISVYRHEWCVWDLAHNKKVKTFSLERNLMTGWFALSHDAKLLASNGLDSFIRLWDVRSGKEVRRFPRSHGHYTIAFSPDDTKLATAQWGKDYPEPGIHIYEVRTGKRLYVLDEGKRGIHTIAFHPHGRYLASTGSDGRVYIWDLGTKKAVHILPHTNATTDLAFSRDGKWLAVVVKGNGVVIWNLCPDGEY